MQPAPSTTRGAARGRLAPSPTGALHLGNARSFLLAWLSIRSQGGALVLRIEDLDHPKVKPWTADQAIEDLRWLGLDWDEGPGSVTGAEPDAPYRQTERRALYADALDRLLAQGLAYPCVCSRRDVEAAQSAPQEGEDAMFYPGTCHGRFATYEEAAAALPAGRLPCWRFRAPDDETFFDDRMRGPQREHAARTVGDFPLARDARGAGYMLAVVVDDAAMGVTEVVRGDDLLGATHRQILLQRALGLPTPAYAHVPLVVAEDGRRLAKRHGDTRLSALRALGRTPSEIVGLLAHWCGWADLGAHVHPAELLPKFSFGTLNPSPAVLTDAIRRFLYR